VPALTSKRDTASDIATLLANGKMLLLYDGVCGLCDRFVQFILRHDKDARMRYATLQGSIGEAIVSRNPSLQSVDSVILVTPSGVYVRSAAALEVMRYLGGRWSLLLALYILPRFVRDWGYDAVARRRYRIWGKYDACPIPPPGVRDRFLD
jgi:predicted DCC family thiol-disulfide oxidoreductase YuxK